MCFGGAKTPAVQQIQSPAPAPVPAPLPMLPPVPKPVASPGPTEISPQTVSERQSRLRQVRAGYLSTVKNVGGMAGVQGDLTGFYGGKAKLGQ